MIRLLENNRVQHYIAKKRFGQGLDYAMWTDDIKELLHIIEEEIIKQ